MRLHSVEEVSQPEAHLEREKCNSTFGLEREKFNSTSSLLEVQCEAECLLQESAFHTC